MSTFHIAVIILLVLILIEVCTPQERRGETSVKLIFGGCLLYALYWVGIWTFELLAFVYDTYGEKIAIYAGMLAVAMTAYGAFVLVQKSIDYLFRLRKRRKLSKQVQQGLVVPEK